MKKMMSMMVICMMAALTQGAAVNWQSGNLFLPNLTAGADYGAFTTTALNNPTANVGYYFLISAADFADSAFLDSQVDAFLAGTLDLSAADSGTVSASGAMGRAANWSTPNMYAAGDEIYVLALYTLSHGGEDWYIMTTAKATIPGTGDNMTVQNLARNIGVWTPVPEPTCMALLALGAAVLGLRRQFRG